MNDSQEPSYYEIALTNRQVMVFFVVLLLCVVGAFFSGVWLGQQRAGEMPTIAQAPPRAELETGEEPLAELNFFTDEQPGEQPTAATPRAEGSKSTAAAGAKPKSVASAGSPETTLLEDLGGSSPSEAPRRAAPIEPSTAPTGAAPVAAGDFVIQVFSSPDAAQARKMLDRMTSGGYQAFISPVEVKGRTMHRVRIGPFTDINEARIVAARVEKALQVDTWVTRSE